MAKYIGNDVSRTFSNFYYALGDSVKIFGDDDIYRKILRVFFKPLAILQCMDQEYEDLKDFRWERIVLS